MKISDYIQGRNNNFNFLRILAAYAVLVTHSFALGVGSASAEPLAGTLGMTLGSIAVDIFFLTSGFLVTASLLARGSVIEFVWARVLRIFPALFFMLVLTVAVLGIFFSTASLASYFTDSGTYTYFVKCLTLISGIAYELPGVFAKNPYGNTVNGSLWTLPYEIKMYAVLAVVWLVLRVLPAFRLGLFKIALVSGTLVAGMLLVSANFSLSAQPGHFVRLGFMFFAGAVVYIFRERIALSATAFWVAAAALLLSLVSKQAFFIVYMATLAYILFFVAYVPSGFIRRYNQLGDYSYGMYIYAFPVQQAIVALVPGISVGSLIIASSLFTFLLAVLSWHLLEKRALRLKNYCVHHTKRLMAPLLNLASART